MVVFEGRRLLLYSTSTGILRKEVIRFVEIFSGLLDCLEFV